MQNSSQVQKNRQNTAVLKSSRAIESKYSDRKYDLDTMIIGFVFFV